MSCFTLQDIGRGLFTIMDYNTYFICDRHIAHLFDFSKITQHSLQKTCMTTWQNSFHVFLFKTYLTTT